MKKIMCDVCGADVSECEAPPLGAMGINGEKIRLTIRAEWDRFGNADVCRECVVKALGGEVA